MLPFDYDFRLNSPPEWKGGLQMRQGADEAGGRGMEDQRARTIAIFVVAVSKVRGRKGSGKAVNGRWKAKNRQ